MTEQDLRAIVRDAIAKHTSSANPMTTTASPTPSWTPAFALFAVPAGADSGGPCVIEPAVACNHCGYCKSYGH